MKYCSNCGKELFDGANVCSECGQAVEETVVEEKIVVEKAPSAAPVEDKISAGLIILSIFVPIAGIIMGAIMMRETPKRGKAYLITGIISAVASYILGTVFSVVFSVLLELLMYA